MSFSYEDLNSSDSVIEAEENHNSDYNGRMKEMVDLKWILCLKIVSEAYQLKGKQFFFHIFGLLAFAYYSLSLAEFSNSLHKRMNKNNLLVQSCESF